MILQEIRVLHGLFETQKRRVGHRKTLIPAGESFQERRRILAR
jgi:hypothetical protein